MKKGTKIISARPIHSVTLRAYCACGGAIHLTTKPDEVELVMDSFAEMHQDEECKPCDSKTAYRARKKLEREIEKAML